MGNFLVKRDDLRECRVAESEPPAVGPGQALLRVDSFGLTANNVTYAVMGEAMSYWDFFPAEDGWGRVPMWGFAEIEQSEADGVEAGTRVFGYLPPSSHLLVTPTTVEGNGFADGSPHRAALPSIYHRYLATGEDPFYRADTEAIQMLMRPLFFTSFLIDDQLAGDGLAERGPILISSASSKTALSAAFLLARREGVELVGLTSARNRDFVESLGIYGRTVSYEEIGSLYRKPATYVDVAGDGAVREAVHGHFGNELLHSMAVGITHWEELGAGQAELPGPTPTFFFAASRIEKRSADWGAAGLEQRVAETWHPFCEWTATWLEPIRDDGLDAIPSAYLDVLENRVVPSTARVISLG
ncbi:MAG: DUF2855 family protein [Solirubrobacterales bacterium]